MNAREIARRVRAWEAGEPARRYSTLHHKIAADKDTLVVAFVRMAGEARPWGIAFGKPNEKPTVLSVPDGRVRDDVGRIAVEFGRALLGHLQTPGYASDAAYGADHPRPLRQVWLPNDSHREMLHHLAFAYATTTYGDDDRDLLNAFGRACGWLFRESERTGQQHVIVAARALSDAYVFPTDDLRQAHLGFLLAWLQTRGSRDDRLTAAREAERQSVSITLDPALDRDKLDDLVRSHNEAGREGKAKAQKAAAAQISAVLRDELTRRFDLVVAARQELIREARPENSYLCDLVGDALGEQWWQCLRQEHQLQDGQQPFFTSIETDWSATGAAERYLSYEAAAEKVARALCHDDAELLAEVIDGGDGLVGTIIGVDDEGVGRTTIQVWTVHASEATNPRLREGSKVCLVGSPKRTAEIRSLTPHPDGGLEVELVITNLKTRINGAAGILGVAPNDSGWVGFRVSFVAASGGGMASRQAQRVWDHDGPGAWLTHSRPARRAGVA